MWKKALQRLRIPLCQQMFLKWKSFRGGRGVGGGIREAGQGNNQSVILRWRRKMFWVLSAFSQWGWEDNVVGGFPHCKCIRVQSPHRGVLHQDQDLNNVALSLSRRHTLWQTCSLLFPKAWITNSSHSVNCNFITAWNMLLGFKYTSLLHSLGCVTFAS